MHIRISTTLKWPIARQIPTSLRARGFKFSINEQVERCDAWIIYQGLRRPEKCIVPEGNVIFFCYEPPGLHNYHTKFLNQFDQIITSHSNLLQPNVTQRQQGQPWLAGINYDINSASYLPRLTYSDFLETNTTHSKDLELGVICSGKDLVPGHAIRRKFVQALETHFGSSIAIHGNWKDVGNNTYVGWQDKWDFISRTKRLIVLENSRVPHYWSEKLADAFLANCLPIYHGCPNICDYFESASHLSIDCGDVHKSIKTIEESLKSGISDEQSLAIQAAKTLVLDKYNLFSEIDALVTGIPATKPRIYSLKDEALFLPGRFLRRFVRMIR